MPVSMTDSIQRRSARSGSTALAGHRRKGHGKHGLGMLGCLVGAERQRHNAVDGADQFLGQRCSGHAGNTERHDVLYDGRPAARRNRPDGLPSVSV